MNSSDLPAKRSLAVQMIMTGNEVEGLSQFKSYCDQLLDNFGNILGTAAPSVVHRISMDLSLSSADGNSTATLSSSSSSAAAEVGTATQDINANNDNNNNTNSSSWMVVKSSSNTESEEILMNVFLTEVQGGVHLNNKRSDVLLW